MRTLAKKVNVKGELSATLLNSETQLRSKRELIERFIQDHMSDTVNRGGAVEEGFCNYWEEERNRAINTMQSDLGISTDNLIQMVEEFHFSGREPRHEDIVASLNQQPKILERRSIIQRVIDSIRNFVQTFDEDIGDI